MPVFYISRYISRMDVNEIGNSSIHHVAVRDDIAFNLVATGSIVRLRIQLNMQPIPNTFGFIEAQSIP